MRTVLAGEVAQAQSYDSDYFVRVEVQNADGTWIDVGAALGTNWITNASWSEHRDTPVSSATFTFIQQIGSDSLAPLMASSALNVDDFGAYAPLLLEGRLVRASTATMPHGDALDTGKYREIFTGRIDNVSGVDNPNSWVGPITITCSDSGAWLMGLQVEKAGTEYGTDAGVALETVVQNDINDNIPAGEPAVTLHKQSSSSYNVTTWKQDEGSLLNSLITLVGDSTGEDIRYRYDTDHVSKLTWFNPDRNRVTVDASFTDTSSFIISLLERDFKNIRNAGELTYTDSTTGLTGKVTSVDTTSNGLYRRQFFRLPSSKMVGNGTDAQAVIDAVVHDLAFPPADATITLPYCWWVQLYDRYTFSANNRQFSDAQTFAVSGYTHTIESGKGQTVLTASARVIGAYARWIRQISQTETTEIRIKNFREVSRTTTDVNFGWTPSGIIQEQWLYLSTPAQPVGSDPWANLVGAPTARLTPDTTSYTVPIPSPGSVTYGRLVPIDANAKNGRVWEFTVQGASVALIQRASIVSTSATQVVVRVAVANPVAGGDVTITYVGGTVSPSSPQTILAASVTTDITTTGYVDFTVTRPAWNAGTDRVTFTANCAGRNPDTDSADIPAQQRDTVYLATRARITASTATTATVRVAVADPTVATDPQTVTVAYTETGGTGTACSPVSGGTVTPAATLTEAAGTYIDYTVTRPDFGTGTRRVTFTATATNRTSSSDAVDIPAVEKTSFGPSLTVTPTPGPTSYSVAWGGDGVTLSIDGAAYGAPGASPITVTRNVANGADKIYAFKGVLDNQTVTDTVVIPAIGAVNTDTVTPDLTVTPGTQTSTAQPFTVSASNPSGGAAPTITVTLHGTTATGSSVGAIVADTPTTIPSGEVVTVTRPAFNTIPASATFKATIASNGSEIIQRTISNQDKLSFGPNLVVTTTPGATSYSIAYSGDAVTLSIDGAAYGAPSASPITVTRNAYNGADKVYVFKGLLDSQTITNTVVVPAQARDLSVNKLTASEITVSSLSAIAADLGTVTSGYIQNSGNTAAIRMSGTATLPTTNFIDFTATGTSPFLKTGVVQINSDGTSSWGTGVVPKTATEARNRCKTTTHTTQSIPNNTFTALTFDIEVFDVGSLHDTSTNNDRITIPTGGDTGTWFFTGTATFAGNATGIRELYIVQNGANTSPLVTMSVPANSTEDIAVTVCAVVNAPAVGDYFTLTAVQTSGGSLSTAIGASPTFKGKPNFSAVHLW